MNNMAKCGESSFNRKVKRTKSGEKMEQYLGRSTGRPEWRRVFAEPKELNVKHNIIGSDLHRLKNRKTGRIEWLYRRELPKDERQVRKWAQGHDGRFCSL